MCRKVASRTGELGDPGRGTTPEQLVTVASVRSGCLFCGGGGGTPQPPQRHTGACNDAVMSERLEVRRAIAADPAAIFEVLTNPQGHVAIDSSGMLMDATGEPVTSVGDSFVVHMDREALNDHPLGLYDVTVKIVTFEPDREIAWKIEGQLNLGHVYGYKLEPIDDGTLVSSYYDWSSVDQSWKDAAIFPVIPESALRATLGILARTVAPGRARPSV